MIVIQTEKAMSVMFSPMRLGNLEINNRFVHSATYEATAAPDGRVTDALIKRYQRLAKGQVGLIIPGYLFTHPLGRAQMYQTGIHTDDMIPGLKRLVDAVRESDGKVVLQIAHAGQQTGKDLVGRTPLGVSNQVRDPIYFFKPKTMTEDQIQEAIDSFGRAAKRAVEAGADGIQLHAAHGYLINQFLSPFFNHRTDKWGGSDENRFRFLKDIILETKKYLPDGMPLLVKLNIDDHTPKPGITPRLAAKYAGWLAESGIDGLEVSCGSAVFAFMNTCRGEVPVAELVASLPRWKRPLGRPMMKRLVGNYDLREAYNQGAAAVVKPAIGHVPLILVGGMRTLSAMTEIVDNNQAEFISLSRPFIRDPHLVKKFSEDGADKVSCISCNRCLAAVPNNIPVRCYVKGFPKKKMAGN